MKAFLSVHEKEVRWQPRQRNVLEIISRTPEYIVNDEEPSSIIPYDDKGAHIYPRTALAICQLARDLKMPLSKTTFSTKQARSELYQRFKALTGKSLPFVPCDTIVIKDFGPFRQHGEGPLEGFNRCLTAFQFFSRAITDHQWSYVYASAIDKWDEKVAFDKAFVPFWMRDWAFDQDGSLTEQEKSTSTTNDAERESQYIKQEDNDSEESINSDSTTSNEDPARLMWDPDHRSSEERYASAETEDSNTEVSVRDTDEEEAVETDAEDIGVGGIEVETRTPNRNTKSDSPPPQVNVVGHLKCQDSMRASHPTQWNHNIGILWKFDAKNPWAIDLWNYVQENDLQNDLIYETKIEISPSIPQEELVKIISNSFELQIFGAEVRTLQFIQPGRRLNVMKGLWSEVQAILAQHDIKSTEVRFEMTLQRQSRNLN